jgi:Cu(I)/Ag(I) efflux system membrane fusion protein
MALKRAEDLGFVTKANQEELPLVIPDTAPLLTGKRAVVYVERKEGEYVLRQVVLGARVGGYYIVKKGLKEGEKVVSIGAFRIDSSAQILAKPSMMSPTGAGGGSGSKKKGEKKKRRKKVKKAKVVKNKYWTCSMHPDIKMKKPGSCPKCNMKLMLVKPTFTAQLKNYWTCSMHPGIKMEKPGECPKCGMTLMKMKSKAGNKEMPKTFYPSLNKAISVYFAVHKALSIDDFKAVKPGSEKLLLAFKNVEKEIKDAGSNELKLAFTSLKKSVSGLKKAKDLAGARLAFSDLAATLKETIEDYGDDKINRVYFYFCPMMERSDGSKGAWWLQKQNKRTLNPYYGKAMQKCGDLKGSAGKDGEGK